MEKEISIEVDEDIYTLFCASLKVAGKDEGDFFDSCMRRFIADTVKAKSSRDISSGQQVAYDENYAMANRRISKWARSPDQINHKIIRAYFLAEKPTGRATLAEMERLCSDKSNPSLYISTFRSNYAQMKLDAPKSHGKVFEDDGETVVIWDAVRDTLMQHKNSFI